MNGWFLFFISPSSNCLRTNICNSAQPHDAAGAVTPAMLSLTAALSDHMSMCDDKTNI